MKRVVIGLSLTIVLFLIPAANTRAFNPDLTDPLVFDCNFYRQIHSFSSMSCAGATDHWLEYGIHEGRASSPVFAVSWYLDFYGDLESVYCPSTPCNYEGAVEHYVDHGREEGRWGHAPMSSGTPYTDYAIKVLDVAADEFAYQFHAIKWSSSSSTPYLAVFDAESWNCNGYPVGDSIGARYGTALAFGARAGDADLVVGRSTEDPWNCTADPAESEHYMKYGAANPHLLLNPSGTTWGMYWLDVLHDSVILPASKRLYGEGDWRHFMMFAMIDAGDITENEPIHAAPFWYHTGDHVTQPSWCCYFQYESGPLINKDMTYASPIWEINTGKYLSSQFTAEDTFDSQGLIGSVTTDSTAQYLYYGDKISGNATLLRRTIDSSMVNMSAPTTIKTFTDDPNARYILVNYHQTANRYVVLYYCQADGDQTYTPDICMQVLTSASLSGLQINFATDASTYGLRLIEDPYLPKYSGSPKFQINQFGVRRDERGRLFNDAMMPLPYGASQNTGQVVIYFPLGTNVGDGQWPYGRDVYAKTVYFPY